MALGWILVDSDAEPLRAKRLSCVIWCSWFVFGPCSVYFFSTNDIARVRIVRLVEAEFCWLLQGICAFFLLVLTLVSLMQARREAPSDHAGPAQSSAAAAQSLTSSCHLIVFTFWLGLLVLFFSQTGTQAVCACFPR